jgi:hypothetical protein
MKLTRKPFGSAAAGTTASATSKAKAKFLSVIIIRPTGKFLYSLALV